MSARPVLFSQAMPAKRPPLSNRSVRQSAHLLILQQVDEPPPETKNRLHVDLIVGPDFEAEAGRLESLGARRLSDVFHEAGTAWIVMADPEGNEFCLGEH